MAIPRGRYLPRRVSQWREEALAHSNTAAMTPRAWRAWQTYVHAIANAIDAGTMTTKFSWSSLAAAVREIDPKVGTSRARVAHYLALLRKAQLLAVVASGRSARYAPKTDNSNERAIYVLCADRWLEAVDTNKTPPLEEAHVPPRTHTRAQHSPTNVVPLRGQNLLAAQARPDSLPAPRRQPLWPSGRTPKRKDEALLAARELQRKLPVLRRISTKHVRSVLRPFFLAGWTPSDIAHAIDHRPSGQIWPHDGATGVGNVGAWLTYRLGAWQDAYGTVAASRSQQAADRQRHQAARARARRETETAQRRQAAPANSPGRLLARAVLEALRTGRPVPTQLPTQP